MKKKEKTYTTLEIIEILTIGIDKYFENLPEEIKGQAGLLKISLLAQISMEFLKRED